MFDCITLHHITDILHLLAHGRYKILVAACADENARHLLTGHHADDQIETFLMRFIHASGLDGLAGIPMINGAFRETHGVVIYRPLLEIFKAELEKLCWEEKLSFFEDPSNRDLVYKRSVIRKLLQEQTQQRAPLDVHGEAGADEAHGALDEKTIDPSSASDVMLGIKDKSSSLESQQVDYESLAQDVLLIQRICSKASAAVRWRAGELLHHSVLQVSMDVRKEIDLTFRDVTDLDSLLAESECGGYETYASRRKRVHWPSQLAALSRELDDVSHLILDARAFSLDAPSCSVAISAVSRVIHAISKTEFPPSSADSTRLATQLLQGKMVGGFTGGACIARPVVRSKGRYVLIVPQRDHHEVMRRMSIARSRTKMRRRQTKHLMGDLLHGDDTYEAESDLDTFEIVGAR